MTWRDRLRKQEPAFDSAVQVEILRRLYGKPRPMRPLHSFEQRGLDVVAAAQRRANLRLNVVPFFNQGTNQEKQG